MAAHLLDHFIFSSRRFKHQTKLIVFSIIAFLIVGNFWWFRGVAWGIDGPVNKHWGLQWRKVRMLPFDRWHVEIDRVYRAGIYTNYNYVGWNVGLELLCEEQLLYGLAGCSYCLKF